jgi:hypothetical protein
LAIICRDHRLLFIMAPRTGCTAIGELLISELGGEYVPAQNVTDADGHVIVRQKHSTLGELMSNGLITQEERGRLFVFSAVRNPFDSLVSLYVKQSSVDQPLLDDPESWVNRSGRRRASFNFARDHTFEEWITHRFRPSLSARIKRLPFGRSVRDRWTEGVDFVMRFERLQDDLNEALRRAGVERQLSIPAVNVTPGRDRDYRTYYSDHSRSLVERHFKRQLDQFGYAF